MNNSLGRFLTSQNFRLIWWYDQLLRQDIEHPEGSIVLLIDLALQEWPSYVCNRFQSPRVYHSPCVSVKHSVYHSPCVFVLSNFSCVRPSSQPRVPRTIISCHRDPTTNYNIWSNDTLILSFSRSEPSKCLARMDERLCAVWKDERDALSSSHWSRCPSCQSRTTHKKKLLWQENTWTEHL